MRSSCFRRLAVNVSSSSCSVTLFTEQQAKRCQQWWTCSRTSHLSTARCSRIHAMTLCKYDSTVGTILWGHLYCVNTVSQHNYVCAIFSLHVIVLHALSPERPILRSNSSWVYSGSRNFSGTQTREKGSGGYQYTNYNKRSQRLTQLFFIGLMLVDFTVLHDGFLLPRSSRQPFPVLRTTIIARRACVSRWLGIFCCSPPDRQFSVDFKSVHNCFTMALKRIKKVLLK